MSSLRHAVHHHQHWPGARRGRLQLWQRQLRPLSRRIADRQTLDGDGVDAMARDGRTSGCEGRPIPIANDMVSFTVYGGVILGMGNGDPTSHEPGQPDQDSARRRPFNGLAHVILAAEPGSSNLVLSAVADGVQSAVLQLPV